MPTITDVDRAGFPFTTPWGKPDHANQIAQGIWEVSTPSHGGFWLIPEVRQQMPISWLDSTFCTQGHAGWFEEDCDWCLVALAFPNCFSKEHQKRAREIAKGWKPDLYAEFVAAEAA